MAMTYSTLIAAKGTVGAIKTWVNYAELDAATVVDEAQTLLYQTLRVREMRTAAALTANTADSSVPLPGASTGQFLEPVTLRDRTNSATLLPSDQSYVSEQRLLALRQYSGGVLTSATPSAVAIFDEAFQFNTKVTGTTTYDAVYYKRPDLLAAGTNETNWLTLRYPHLLRAACLAAAADYMKDDAEYAKAKERMILLIQGVNEENKRIDEQMAPINDTPIDNSLLSFVSDRTTPIQAVLTEAQALLATILRTREMRTEYTFSVAAGTSYVALPTGFLDPIGRMQVTSYGVELQHYPQNFVQSHRIYTESSGTLGTNPFTTTSGSTLVSVAKTGHGFSQDSTFRVSGASTFNGVTITGTFPITSITDADNFVIDITDLGATPSGSGSGGGAAVAYVCDNLVQGMPGYFAIWNERIYFDSAFSQSATCRLQYFKAPTALTAADQSNWLTTRYPHLFRIACQAAQANMRQDDQAYSTSFAKLSNAAKLVNVENDMAYRGMELLTENP